MKGAFFNLDGVIVSTDKFHYQAWKQIADEEGIYFDEIINNHLRGASRMESLEIILERANKLYTVEEKGKLSNRKNERYVKLLNTLSSKDVFGALDVIREIKARGIKTAIGSSSKNAASLNTTSHARSLSEWAATNTIWTSDTGIILKRYIRRVCFD